VVDNVPVRGVESVQVALQFTLMVELGERAARSAALSVCVNVWDVAAGGVAFSVGDAVMDRAVVLSVPWDVEKVPVSDWFQSLYRVQVSVAPAPNVGALLHVADTDWKRLLCAEASVANTTSPATASTDAKPPCTKVRTRRAFRPAPPASRREACQFNQTGRIPPRPSIVAK
jgi:hypothetical protein